MAGHPEYGEAFWDQHYGTAPAIWSGRPNAQLVAEVADLPPGTALDVGCGEGADAVWLASRGWRVTGVDISAVALGRAAEAAAAAGVAADWVRADLIGWTPPAGAFDLVSAHFLHLAGEQRRTVYARLAAAVAPGGTLLLVAHEEPVGEHAAEHRASGWDMTGRFSTAAEEAAALDPAEWEVLVAEHRPRTTTRPDGQQVSRPDVVLRARRR